MRLVKKFYLINYSNRNTNGNFRNSFQIVLRMLEGFPVFRKFCQILAQFEIFKDKSNLLEYKIGIKGTKL